MSPMAEKARTFISLPLALPPALRLAAPGAWALLLLKLAGIKER